MASYVEGLGFTSSEITSIYTGSSTEPIILVDAVNRTMEVAEDHRILGVVGDHNSNPVRFRCPRYIDAGDLLTCTNMYIAWQNKDAGTRGETDIDDFQADPDAPDEYVVGTWLVDYTTCAAAGFVEIILTAVQVDDDGEVVYEWQTLPNDEMEVKAGVDSDLNTVSYSSASGGSFSIDEDELVAMLEEVLV